MLSIISSFKVSKYDIKVLYDFVIIFNIKFIISYLYKSEVLRYPTYFDILREGFKSSYNPEAEYRSYYSGFSGSLVDIEEKEEIDGVKYYKLFFYPG
jgi:hypothetical protein